ncbi:hypothetical protein NF868_11555 [Bacillus zhangzhouensis]|nr:hypothetical protein NF868_11555 [Bacillus zhangzhouensis]
MSEQITEKIQLVKEKMNIKNKEINSKKEEYESLIDIQINEVRRILKEIKPLIDHFRDKKFAFNNKKLQFHSYEGPVVGVDKDIDEYYVLSSNGIINGYNIYSNEKTKPNIALSSFLSVHSFETLLESLLETLDIQDRILGAYQDKIEDAKSSLKKYHISF